MRAFQRRIRVSSAGEVASTTSARSASAALRVLDRGRPGPEGRHRVQAVVDEQPRGQEIQRRHQRRRRRARPDHRTLDARLVKGPAHARHHQPRRPFRAGARSPEASAAAWPEMTETPGRQPRRAGSRPRAAGAPGAARRRGGARAQSDRVDVDDTALGGQPRRDLLRPLPGVAPVHGAEEHDVEAVRRHGRARRSGQTGNTARRPRPARPRRRCAPPRGGRRDRRSAARGRGRG